MPDGHPYPVCIGKGMKIEGEIARPRLDRPGRRRPAPPRKPPDTGPKGQHGGPPLAQAIRRLEALREEVAGIASHSDNDFGEAAVRIARALRKGYADAYGPDSAKAKAALELDIGERFLPAPGSRDLPAGAKREMFEGGRDKTIRLIEEDIRELREQLSLAGGATPRGSRSHP
jgi:hypothetical protein